MNYRNNINFYSVFAEATDKFNLDEVPILYLFQCDTEKTDFDLSKIPDADKTFSVCYLAVSYNPRQNLLHVPLTIFEKDNSLVFYTLYKRYLYEVPEEIEQLIVANYHEQLLQYDPNVLVKYIKNYPFPNEVYKDLLWQSKITYNQIPSIRLYDIIKGFSEEEHQFIVRCNRIKFDEVPIFARLMIFTDDFIIELIREKTHSITDFPYTYITNKVIKYLIETGEISPDTIPKCLIDINRN